MKLDLINREEDRQYIMENSSKNDLIDMLKQYGEVVDYFTESMVTDFFKVEKRTIDNIGTRKSKELSQYGYKVYTYAELKQLQQNRQLDGIKIPPRGLRLYPIQAVIIIGMMLTESEVAEKLRSDIIKDNSVLDEMKQLRKEIEELNKKINLLENKEPYTEKNIKSQT